MLAYLIESEEIQNFSGGAYRQIVAGEFLII